MSSLSEKDVEKIAKLARIKVSAEEKQKYAAELSNILQFVATLQEVNTDGVPQMTSVAQMALPQRVDEVSDGGYRDDILATAPENEYGCFMVPKVLE